MTDTLNRKTQHNQAMGYAQEAILAEQRGEHGEALQLYRKAFLMEKEVAMTFFNDLAKQPTRAVLFRSAATLAKNCGEIGEAIQLITYGKSGNPPASIINELDQLYLDLTCSLPANTIKKGLILEVKVRLRNVKLFDIKKVEKKNRKPVSELRPAHRSKVIMPRSFTSNRPAY